MSSGSLLAGTGLRNVTLHASELWCYITIIHPKPCHVHRGALRQSINPTVAEFDVTVALLAYSIPVQSLGKASSFI